MSLSNSLNISYLHSSLLHHSVPLVDLGGAAGMFVPCQSNFFHFFIIPKRFTKRKITLTEKITVTILLPQAKEVAGR